MADIADEVEGQEQPAPPLPPLYGGPGISTAAPPLSAGGALLHLFPGIGDYIESRLTPTARSRAGIPVIGGLSRIGAALGSPFGAEEAFGRYAAGETSLPEAVGETSLGFLGGVSGPSEPSRSAMRSLQQEIAARAQKAGLVKAGFTVDEAARTFRGVPEEDVQRLRAIGAPIPEAPASPVNPEAVSAPARPSKYEVGGGQETPDFSKLTRVHQEEHGIADTRDPLIAPYAATGPQGPKEPFRHGGIPGAVGRAVAAGDKAVIERIGPELSQQIAAGKMAQYAREAGMHPDVVRSVLRDVATSLPEEAGAAVREAVAEGRGIPADVLPVVDRIAAEAGVSPEAARAAVVADARMTNAITESFGREPTAAERVIRDGTSSMPIRAADPAYQKVLDELRVANPGASETDIEQAARQLQIKTARVGGPPKPPGPPVRAAGPPDLSPTAPQHERLSALAGYLGMAFDLPRSVVAGLMPYHGMFRHAKAFIFKDFGAWLSGWRGGSQALVETADQTYARLSGMRARMTALAEQLGLGPDELARYRDPAHGVTEERIVNPLYKIPGVGELFRRTQAGFAMSLNEVEHQTLLHLIEDSELSAAAGRPVVRPDLTAEEAKGLALDVKTLIGLGFDPRGGPIGVAGHELGRVSPAVARAFASVASKAFFAPSLKVSRVRIWTNLLEGIGRLVANGQDVVAQQYVKSGVAELAGIGSTYVLFNALGYPAQLKDWASTQFGKIDIGPRSERAGLASALASGFGFTTQTLLGRDYLDPTEGEGPLLREVVRVISERSVNAKGRERVLGEGFAAPTRGSEIANYISGQLNPALSPLQNIMADEPIDWQRFNLPMFVEAYLTGSGHRTGPGTEPYRDAVGRLNDGTVPPSPAQQAWEDVRKGSALNAKGEPSFSELKPTTERTVPGGVKGVLLDDKEFDRLQELTGLAREQHISALTSTRAWASLGQGDKEKRLLEARERADKEGTTAFGLEHAQQATDDRGRTAGALIALRAAGTDTGRRMDTLFRFQQEGLLPQHVTDAINDLRTYKDPLGPQYQLKVSEYLQGADLVQRYLSAPAFRHGTPADWTEVERQSERLRTAYQRIQREAEQQNKRPSQMADYRTYRDDFNATQVGGLRIQRYLEFDGRYRHDEISAARTAIAQDPLFKHFRRVVADRDPYRTVEEPAP